MLAQITVNSFLDNGDGAKTTLREAIEIANVNPNSDEIIFSTDPADAINGATIALAGELEIIQSVTIDASMLPDGITIDAGGGTDHTIGNGDGFTVFVIGDMDPMAPPIDATFVGLTITGGDAGNGLGGGIDFTRRGGSLTILDSKISGNATNAKGGGINANNLTLHIEKSEISGNTSQGNGGGLYLYGVNPSDIVDTTISGNTATGSGTKGGGIHARTLGFASDPTILTIDRTTISGNTAEESGGGLFVIFAGTDSTETLNLSNSTLSGNQVLSRDGGGAYICTKFGAGVFTGTNNTFSGNQAGEDTGRGGGLFLSRETGNDGLVSNLNHLTVTDNVAASGGGLYSTVDSLIDTHLKNSIISGNRNFSAQPNNVSGAIDSAVYSLFGNSSAALPSPTNFLNDNAPSLSVLTFHGGPTQTHALLSGSNAIDGGDPSAVPGAGDEPNFDQRGNPFSREFGSRVDIGAYEVNPPKIIDVIIRNVGKTGVNAHEYSFAETLAKEPDMGKQLAPIKVNDAKEFKIKFSENVDTSTLNLNVQPLTFIGSVGLTFMGYDSANFVATWEANSTLPVFAQYLIQIADTVTASGMPTLKLDGDWFNPATTVPTATVNPLQSEFPSGDGTIGGSFYFAFTSLMPNENDNTVVENAELTALLNNWATESGIAFSDGDFDGNGKVENADLTFLLNTWSFSLNAILRLDLVQGGVINSADLAAWDLLDPGDPDDVAAGDVNGDGVLDTDDRDIIENLASLQVTFMYVTDLP